MLTIERGRRGFAALPQLARIGVAVLALGGLADVMAHLEAVDHAAHLHEHTAAQISAHLVAFVGMVLILVGVVHDGVRRTSLGRRRRGTSKGDA